MLSLFYRNTVNLEYCVFYCDYFIWCVSCTVVVLNCLVMCECVCMCVFGNV